MALGVITHACGMEERQMSKRNLRIHIHTVTVDELQGHDDLDNKPSLNYEVSQVSSQWACETIMNRSSLLTL